MIQKAPVRSSRSRRSPSTGEISRRREEIQAQWSLEERTNRRPTLRLDQGDARLNAHLRFIEFLVATQAPAPRRRKSSSRN